jgi:hypothetical protein
MPPVRRDKARVLWPVTLVAPQWKVLCPLGCRQCYKARVLQSKGAMACHTGGTPMEGAMSVRVPPVLQSKGDMACRTGGTPMEGAMSVRVPPVLQSKGAMACRIVASVSHRGRGIVICSAECL